MKTKRYKIGILGCGWIMRGIYTPIIQRFSDQAEVRALCDLSAENLQTASRNFPQAATYSKPEEFVESDDLDAVMILTSERANARMAALALQAGLDVFLEKPPAISLKEFDWLVECEAKASGRLYSAFNRRHTPLLKNVEFPSPIQNVRGRMERRRRNVDIFPYTAIHLIDSVQFYAGSPFSEAEVSFGHLPSLHWKVRGAWPDGGTCHLEFFPTGDDHCEWLVIEDCNHVWEIQFPNPASAFPRGRFQQTTKRPPASITCFPDVSGDDHAQMGYASAFRRFIDFLGENSLPEPLWSLSACRTTIAIMESMTRKSKKELHLSLKQDLTLTKSM